jgi:hypothetical protein
MAILLSGGSELKLIGTVLLIYGYIYHFILGLLLTAIACLTLASGQHNLHLAMLPWKGQALTFWVLALGLGAILFVVLAATRLFRYAFPLWCLFVAIMMFRGFFMTGAYVFSGPSNFRAVVWLTIGALGAFLASLQLFKPRALRK